MPKSLSNPNTRFPTLKRVKQKTSVHCGPAALEMLFSFLGYETNQEAIVEASGLTRHRLDLYGMNIRDLARASHNLFPDLQFWFKNNSTVNELVKLVEIFEYPVGVEWQGVFDYDPTQIEVEFDPDYGEEDDDQGHYSVVTHVDTFHNVVMLADPYRVYAGVDRRFTLADFTHRWWDENEGEIEVDFHMMFVVTPRADTFPESLGMQKGEIL